MRGYVLYNEYVLLSLFLHFLFWYFSRPRHIDDAKGFTGYCFEQRVGWGGVREGVAAPAVRIEKAIHGE